MTFGLAADSLRHFPPRDGVFADSDGDYDSDSEHSHDRMSDESDDEMNASTAAANASAAVSAAAAESDRRVSDKCIGELTEVFQRAFGSLSSADAKDAFCVRAANTVRAFREQRQLTLRVQVYASTSFASVRARRTDIVPDEVRDSAAIVSSRGVGRPPRTTRKEYATPSHDEMLLRLRPAPAPSSASASRTTQLQSAPPT